MESSIFRFILRHSRRQQLLLLAITLASFPFLYASLELPKKIVNEAISGKNIPAELFGVPMDQVRYLLILSGLFLALVVVNGWFKYQINTMKGRLGERMLRRLRYELYVRILRFPLPRFRKVSSGEIIPMITAEVEPLGGFIGDAIALPVFQGGTLLVYLVFIFMQDPVLGAAAVSLYPFQGWLIPRLQRKVNQLGKQRVRTMRQISDRIGETVAGIGEVHTHDTSAWHKADLAHRLGDIYDIRFEIYQRKFFIKFLNNFINQLTPFFFYSIGGYLVIKGQLSFGALVAVLAAYKDLASPWKELLDWYQLKEDTRIKYDQVVEQFQVPDLLDDRLLEEEPKEDVRIKGRLTLDHVQFGEEGGAKLLDDVSGEIELDRHTAVVAVGAGGEELAQIVARVLMPTAGRIRLNGEDFTRLPESVTGRRVAYVGSNPYLYSAPLFDNLVYGLRHRPLRPDPKADPARRKRRTVEANMSGNTDRDIRADWIDYESAGCTGPEDLVERIRDVLRMVDLDADVYSFGLNRTVDPERRPDVAARVLAAREAVTDLLTDPKMGQLVERFDPERFNTNATVAENLLFGTPVGSAFATDTLAENPYMLHVLDKTGLSDRFLEAGRKVAETMLELFSGLPQGHEFFERFSFIGFAELPEYQAILAHAGKDGLERLRPEERTRLMSLPFKLVPARHRLGLLDDKAIARLLEARRVFAKDLPADLRGAVEFFDPRVYNAAATIQDNILFGKLVYGQAQVQARVGRMMAKLVDDLELRELIVEVGLDHPVGVGGSRLTAAQRQKAALARALLKNPDLLVLGDATSSLDSASETKVHAAIRKERDGRGLLWVVHRAGHARSFERVIVLNGGRVAEEGRSVELDKPGTLLHELMGAD